MIMVKSKEFATMIAGITYSTANKFLRLSLRLMLELKLRFILNSRLRLGQGFFAISSPILEWFSRYQIAQSSLAQHSKYFSSVYSWNDVSTDLDDSNDVFLWTSVSISWLKSEHLTCFTKKLLIFKHEAFFLALRCLVAV